MDGYETIAIDAHNIRIRPKWVNVKDKLPLQEPEMWPTYDWVLVTDMETITIARFGDDGWQFLYSNDSECEAPFSDCSKTIYLEKITHWMPIPKMPEKK
jgi:hypothetical protein